jgi:hypothetical protein
MGFIFEMDETAAMVTAINKLREYKIPFQIHKLVGAHEVVLLMDLLEDSLEDSSPYWLPTRVNPRRPVDMEEKFYIQTGTFTAGDGTFEWKSTRQCIAEDRKIQAIKNIREMTGWGLKDAKDFVEVNFYNDPCNRKGK